MTILTASLPDIRQLARPDNERQVRYDALIETNRLATPPSLLNKRRRDRLTIQELNRLSDRGIAAGISPIDEGDFRSPAIRFLDLIDLPRNTMVNAIFGDATVGQRAGAVGAAAGVGAAFGSFGGPVGALVGAGVGAGIAGGLQLLGEAFVGDETQRLITAASERRGTFAQPVIFFSDVLRQVGLEDRATRAVVGFVGDVVFDPLTYVSGGGNVVSWASRGGNTIRMSRPGSLLLRDMAGHYANTGTLLQGKAYQPLHELFSTTVLDPATGSLRHVSDKSLAAVLKETAPTGAALTFKAERARIERLLQETYVEAFRTQSPAGASARDFFRRYGAHSARQFTFPFAGILANVTRTPLDIPIGRLGTEGRMRQAIAKTDAEFNAILTEKAGLLAGKAQETRKTYDEAVAAFAPFSTPKGVLKGRLGARVPTDQLDGAVLALHDMLAARGPSEDSARLLSQFERGGVDALVSGLDHFHRTFGYGDGADLYAGPRGLLNMIPWKHREAYEVSQQMGAATRVYSQERRAIVQMLNKKRAMREALEVSDDAEPSNIARLSDDIETLEKIRTNVEDGHSAAMVPLREKLGTITSGTWFKTWQRAHNVRRDLRSKLRIGPETAATPITREHRRSSEELAKYLGTRAYREFDASLAPLKTKYPDAGDNVANAIIIHMHLGRAGREGVKHGNDLGGRPWDKTAKMAEIVRRDAPGLLDDPKVAELAQQWLRFSDKMLAEGQAAGIISPDIIPHRLYWPHIFSKEATESAREAARMTTARGSGLASPQGFMRHRTTDRYFYRLANGEERFVWGGELVRVGARGKMTVDMKRRVAEFQDALENGRAEILLDEAGRPILNELGTPIPKAYVTSPYELNDLADKGRFHALVSPDIAGETFSTDFLTVIARRTMAQERAIANARFEDQMVQLARVLPTDANETELLPPSLVARGAVRDPLNSGAIILDGISYRRLNKAQVRNAALRLPISDRAVAYYYPIEVADEIEQYASRLQSPTQVSDLLRGYDRVLDTWKKVTLYHPSWWTLNVIGNLMNSYAGAGARPQHWPRFAKDAFSLVHKIHGGKVALSNKRHLTFGRYTHSEAEWGEILLRNGFVNPHSAIRDIVSTGRVAGQSEKQWLASMGSRGPLGKFLGSWWRINAETDDMSRVLTGIDLLDQGHDIDGAARLTRKALFDYGDLSDFERSVGTRVWPFFIWQRNNVALQIHLLLQKPAFASRFPKVQAAIEEALVDEQAVPFDMRPRWMKDLVATQIAASNGEAKFLMLSLFTPMQEIIEIGQGLFGSEGFAEVLKYATSSTAPPIKAIFELAAGEELFTGRELGDPDLGKISYSQYLAQQLRPYREVTNVRRWLSHDDFGPDEAVLRAILGGRIQQTSEERLARGRSFEEGQTIRALRTTAKRAIADGDEATAQRLAVEIQERYRILWNVGAMDQVPKALRARFARDAAADRRRRVAP